jgi:hypothetical protein
MNQEIYDEFGNYIGPDLEVLPEMQLETDLEPDTQLEIENMGNCTSNSNPTEIPMSLCYTKTKFITLVQVRFMETRCKY